MASMQLHLHLIGSQELLEKAMQSLMQTIEWETDPREQRTLQLKKQSLQDELSNLRQRLADHSQVW